MNFVFLIADDSPHKINLMRMMLRHAKWEGDIVIAQTTEEAKALIDMQSVAYAFIDFYIPSENGPAIIDYLKKKNAAARIALVSSSDKKENFDTAKAAGAETCICTTYASDEVERAFKDVLDRWRGRF